MVRLLGCSGARAVTIRQVRVFDKPVLPMHIISYGLYIESRSDGRARTAPRPAFAYKADRLKPLRAFCQTRGWARCRAPPRRCTVSQPAITLQLQALERELGVEPVRAQRPAADRPTREGEALYALARPLVEGIDGLDRDFRRTAARAGRRRADVAAGTSTILYLLPRHRRSLPRSTSPACACGCTTSPARTAWTCCARTRSTSRSARCSTCRTTSRYAPVLPLRPDADHAARTIRWRTRTKSRWRICRRTA